MTQHHGNKNSKYFAEDAKAWIDLMKENGWKKTDLAKHLGMNYATLCNILEKHSYNELPVRGATPEEKMNCGICSSPLSEPITELFALPTVTSDCRPWSYGKSVTICSGCGVMRRVTNEQYKEGLYDGYKSYPEPTGRTEKILKFIDSKMPEPKSILDIGCGVGHGLKILGAHYPQAAVFGYEPHSAKLETFRENFTVLAERPTDRKFDLVTLFHVLEHIEDLSELLGYIKTALAPSGHVLIQVPYTSLWPFDLVIADHVWHFNTIALECLFLKAGFDIKHIGNKCLKKEITLLATIGKGHPIVCYSPLEKEAIADILSYKDFLDGITQQVAIYGTGPAAAWAASILGDNVRYFVDDDVCRQDVVFNGKEVFSPSWIDSGGSISKAPSIVAPFPQWQLPEIKARHSHLRFL